MQEKVSEFEDLGISVVASTYDSTESNAEFTEGNDITYPILSDSGGSTVKRFGILNEAHEEGTFAYGVPHPGIMLMDTEGKILLKRAEEQYRFRPSIDDLLEDVKAMVESSETEEASDDEESED